MTSLTPDLIRRNRASFMAVPEWLPGRVYQASRYCYGVSSRALPLLDKPINGAPTYSDLLAAVAIGLGRPVSYLEIGVSVGKNFYCLTRALEHSTLIGLDWEAPSPVLEGLLTPAGEDGTVRTYRAGTNVVQYVQGDEFNPETWKALAGRQFDIIFSDAWHEGRALLMEFKMISMLRLLNPGGFLMMWDDLNRPSTESMDRAYHSICTELRTQFGAALQSGLVEVNGWLGEHEPPHWMGVATTLGITAAELAAALDAVRSAADADGVCDARVGSISFSPAARGSVQ